MRRFLAIVLLLSGLALACSTPAIETPPAPTETGAQVEAPAQGTAGGGQPPLVRVHERVGRQTYPVSGSNAGELRASLNRSGPYASGGRRYDAVSSWELRWSFRYDREPDVCSLAAATVEISIVVILPELADPDALGPALLKRWQSYRAALEEHEAGHVQRELAGARELETAFRAAPALASCGELGAYLNALGEVAVAMIRATDVQYETETGHGRTQGAVFP